MTNCIKLFFKQDGDLILMTVHNIVTQTLPQWETRDIADIEVAVYLLYTLGEAVPVSKHSQNSV